MDLSKDGSAADSTVKDANCLSAKSRTRCVEMRSNAKDSASGVMSV